MQVMIERQSHFQPFGLPYWGFADLNKGVGSMTASYSHLVVEDSSGKTPRSGQVKNDRRCLADFSLAIASDDSEFCPFFAGRIGRAHAKAVSANPDARRAAGADALQAAPVHCHPIRCRSLGAAVIAAAYAGRVGGSISFATMWLNKSISCWVSGMNGLSSRLE
jgi:hypothetical protein